MTDIPNIQPDSRDATILAAPDKMISVREMFGIDVDMECPAFSEADERVPDRDDAYVFDGFAPREPPPAGALLFRPTATDWLPTADRGHGPVSVDDWDRTSRLASGVPWNALSIRHASPWTR